MNNITTINTKTLDLILSRLNKLTKDVEAIKKRFFKKEPLYGSDAWWDASNKKALEDVRKGRVTKFDSAKNAITWLNS